MYAKEGKADCPFTPNFKHTVFASNISVEHGNADCTPVCRCTCIIDRFSRLEAPYLYLVHYNALKTWFILLERFLNIVLKFYDSPITQICPLYTTSTRIPKSKASSMQSKVSANLKLFSFKYKLIPISPPHPFRDIHAYAPVTSPQIKPQGKS